MLYDGKDYYFSNKYKMQIVDRVGGVDSFGAGLIAASLEGYDAKVNNRVFGSRKLFKILCRR